MLKWLVNSILKALGGILGFHCLWKPRLMQWLFYWGPRSIKCSKNGRPRTSLHAVGLKQLVNCFLKAHEGSYCFSLRESISLVKINQSCKIEYKNCKYTLVDVWACSSSSTASSRSTDTFPEGSWRKSLFFYRSTGFLWRIFINKL